MRTYINSILFYLPSSIFNKPRAFVTHIRRYTFSPRRILWEGLITAQRVISSSKSGPYETFSGLSTNHRRFIRLPSCSEITIVTIVAGHHLQSMPRKQYGVYSQRIYVASTTSASFYSRDTKSQRIRLIRIQAVIKYLFCDGSLRLRVVYASVCTHGCYKRTFQLRLIMDFSLSEKWLELHGSIIQ